MTVPLSNTCFHDPEDRPVQILCITRMMAGFQGITLMLSDALLITFYNPPRGLDNINNPFV
jgi:hypothetical protein